MFILKALLRSLILPPAGLLILAVLGLVLLRRRRNIGLSLLIFSVASLWLLSTPLIADSLTRVAERFPALDLTRPVQAQAIVILGGGSLRFAAPEYGGPAPEMELLERLTYGAFVARKTALPVLVSGSPREAFTMRVSLARDFGITARWVEDQSRDTFENARFSVKLLHADGVKRIILVTSSTHLWRATHEFQSAGVEVVPAPVGNWGPRQLTVLRLVPSPQGLLHSNAALYELIGEPVRRILALLHVRRQADATTE